MTFAWQRRHTLAAGLALILLSNAVIIGGVAYNRSGEPEATLRLTERELGLRSWERSSGENSGLALQVNWRVLNRASYAEGSDEPFYYAGIARGADWLDAAKLAELGFEGAKGAGATDFEYREQRQLEKPVFLVLEFNGPAYAAALELTQERVEKIRKSGAQDGSRRERGLTPEEAVNWLERERHNSSRLFAVDAGLDAGALRRKYPDRERYAVVTGRVRPYFRNHRSGARALSGYISSLNIDRINVPLAYHPVIDNQKVVRAGRRDAVEPGFEAIIAYGRRLEPRVVEIKAK